MVAATYGGLAGQGAGARHDTAQRRTDRPADTRASSPPDRAAHTSLSSSQTHHLPVPHRRAVLRGSTTPALTTTSHPCRVVAVSAHHRQRRPR